jgi:tRNA-dihydrouridine synthase
MVRQASARLASESHFNHPVRDFLPIDLPGLVLAPMQNVTDLPFMRVIARRGGPDWFVTEFLRVHANSRPDRYILRSITENQTGRPVFAQIIGSDAAEMCRMAKELQRYNIAGIDLNLGCPSPTVCGKSAGGGLLRNPQAVDAMVGALRDAIAGRFTVKTRLGFADEAEFDSLLAVFQKHAIDGLTIHARTVADRYQTPVRPSAVHRAVETLPCPVVANGNVVNAEAGWNLLRRTKAAGLMIGRGAIRNPWIFQQIRQTGRGLAPMVPTRRDLLGYISELYEEIAKETRDFDEKLHVQRMKKTMLYIVQGLGEETEQAMRRVATEVDFFAICQSALDHSQPLADVPPEQSKLFCGFGELLGG